MLLVADCQQEPCSLVVDWPHTHRIYCIDYKADGDGCAMVCNAVLAAVSIVSGQAADRSAVDYGFAGSTTSIAMSAFAALGTIAFR